MEQPEERIALTQNALVAFLNATVDLHEKRPVQACNGSRMAHDVSAFGKKSPFDNAVTVSDLAFQYTHDHLSLFAYALTRSCDPITSCTLIRSSLEAAAVGAWVVDPTISTLERVARVYSIRYESIVQNVKVLRCSKGIKQSDLDQTIARIDVIATDADACGVPVGRCKGGKVTWVGTKKPSATECPFGKRA